MRATLKFLVGYVLVSLMLGAGLLVSALPRHPSSIPGWIALFTFALPITIAGEFVGELLFARNPLTKAVELRTRHAAFSLARILYVLVLLLVVIATVVAAFHFFGGEPPA